MGFVTSFNTVQRTHTNNEVGIDGYEKRIGGVTVIDSSRNLTNIKGISASQDNVLIPYVFRKNEYSGYNGAVAKFVSTHGHHSWGINTEFRVDDNDGDRPSILFSHGADNKTWSVGYGGGTSDYFRINRDHGYHNSAWGIAMMTLDRSGNVVFAGNVSAENGLQINGTTVIDSSRNLTNISSISSSGNVEIGTYATTGTGVLHLNGSTANRQSTLQTTNGNLHIDSHSGFGVYLNYMSSTGFVMLMQNKAKVDSSGNAIFNGNVTAYGSASDIRLKYDVARIDNALDKVLKLDGVNFKYKKDDTKSTGVIAQQVQDVLPQAVYETSEIGSDDKYLAVRYGNMVGLLIEAIKELKQEIEVLKNGTNSN